MTFPNSDRLGPYDLTPRPDTDCLNGPEEGGGPDETEPGIFTRRAMARSEREAAAAAAAAKTPLHREVG